MKFQMFRKTFAAILAAVFLSVQTPGGTQFDALSALRSAHPRASSSGSCLAPSMQGGAVVARQTSAAAPLDQKKKSVPRRAPFTARNAASILMWGGLTAGALALLPLAYLGIQQVLHSQFPLHLPLAAIGGSLTTLAVVSVAVLVVIGILNAACGHGFFLPRRLFYLFMSVLVILSLLLTGCTGTTSAPAPQNPPAAQESVDQLSSYQIPGLDGISSDDNIEGYVREKLWTQPANIRALVDSSSRYQVPRSISLAILSTEIFAMRGDLRRAAEQGYSSINKYDTFSFGLAQIQVRHAVRLFPQLYSDAMTDPAAPQYLKDRLARFAHLADPAVIAQRGSDNKYQYFDDLKALLEDDVICIYLMNLYIRESLQILHVADPSTFRDPSTFTSFTVPSAAEAGAAAVYYVEGPFAALNPDPGALEAWKMAYGDNIPDVPDVNIYILKVRHSYDQMGSWIPIIQYLRENIPMYDRPEDEVLRQSINDDYYSDEMQWVADVWLLEHGQPYDEGLFGLAFTNTDVRLAQTYAPQYAFVARVFAYSSVYGFIDQGRYPVNWYPPAASSAPAQPGQPSDQTQPQQQQQLPDGYAAEAGTGRIYYTVQSGDMLSAIAIEVMNNFYPEKDYDEVFALILSLNPSITDPGAISVGQIIYVSSGPLSGTQGTFYFMAAALVPSWLARNLWDDLFWTQTTVFVYSQDVLASSV